MAWCGAEWRVENMKIKLREKMGTQAYENEVTD